jgi:rare lipoprotein A
MTIAFLLLLLVTAAHDVAARGTASQSGARAEAAPSRSSPARETSQTAAGSSRVRTRGFATYYAKMFDGRLTASGISFDNDAMVAAHPHYPFGTVVRVTNLRNGRSTDVRIVDRGPARRARASGVIIDLSRAAARKLGFITAGRTRVRLDILELPDDEGS